ncbi:MAG: hypothetical protein ABL962_03585 [Fimbriimonadaceae bacterium]
MRQPNKLLGTFLTLAILAAFSGAEPYNGTPAGHLIYRHTTAEIKAKIVDGWRPTSVGYESTTSNLGRFIVTYVQNTGSHFKECRFEGDVSSAPRGGGLKILSPKAPASTPASLSRTT